MSEKLQQLFRDEADLIGVPPPPVAAVVTDARRKRRVRRTRALVAVAASVVLVVGGVVLTRYVGTDDDRGARLPVATPPASSAPPGGGRLDVSGTGVGADPFGTDAEEVLAAVTDRLGEPDLELGPQQYFRGAALDAWFEDADDPLSPSWQYPVTSVACWGGLCLLFGGDDPDALKLRGWELAQLRRWSGFEEVQGPDQPDVRLADTGIRLGDGWRRLHAAYPDTVVNGGEGASLTVRNTPWPVIFDGVGGWRLSGQWDPSQPTTAPPGAVVTRLSGGQGPEPGCC